MNLDLKEFLPGYLAETEEHLQSSRANLLAVEAALDKNETSPKAVRELFRSLHTIKGLSAMIGVEPIVELAHAMETVLRTADKSGGRLPKGATDPLVHGLRAIDERVADLAAERPVRPAPGALIDALNAIDAAAAVPAKEAEISGGQRTLRVDFSPSRERADAGITISTVRERLGKIAEIIKVVPRSHENGVTFTLVLTTAASVAEIAEAAAAKPEAVEVIEEIKAPPAAAPEEEPQPEAASAFVRVEISRLDDALEKLSSLVVTRFRLARAVAALAEKGTDVRELMSIVGENTRGLRDLRGSIMRARMVSVSDMLDRVPLLVRTLSLSTKKNVQATINGGQAELDKAVAERLFPALVHLVRNAVDHGIESAEARKRAGKPDLSIITVRGIERGTNRLELTIEDDGGGIDREKVAARAGRPVPATDAELLDLICTPGLSTKDQATQTSGRGFGMDIVRRVVRDELGGELELSTTPGQGTTFTVRVPLTITIVDAFSFVCGGSPFVVPVSIVEEIVELESPADFFIRRGEVVTLLRLRELFSMPSDRNNGDRSKGIVVRRNGELYAFAVDRMVGREEIVVRPLQDPLVRVPGVTGATDLGDGKPTLVLDLIALSKKEMRS